jgi:hypothetical protein
LQERVLVAFFLGPVVRSLAGLFGPVDRKGNYNAVKGKIKNSPELFLSRRDKNKER